jgi:hypothetical protein
MGNTMNNSVYPEYVEPDIDWLKKQFTVPLGAVRLSEMEIPLAYLLMYHNSDLDKSEYDLAEIYHFSEAKARRLKTEFGLRYRRISDFASVVAGIGKKLFMDRIIEIDYDQASGKVSFPLTDPLELRAMKQALDFNNLPYHGDFNGKLVKLTADKFICIFLRYYSGLYETLKSCLSKNLKNKADREHIFNTNLPLGYKAKKLIAPIAKEAVELAIGAIAL